MTRRRPVRAARVGQAPSAPYVEPLVWTVDDLEWLVWAWDEEFGAPALPVVGGLHTPELRPGLF